MIAANRFNTIGTSFGSARSVKTGNIVGSSTITDMTRFSVTPRSGWYPEAQKGMSQISASMAGNNRQIIETMA
jgi:hypothetical protein